MQFNSGNTNFSEPQNKSVDLPNAPATRTLGVISLICSVVFSWCYGIGIPIAIITGILGLVYAQNALTHYKENPQKYTDNSYYYIRLGRITSIISVCICALWLVAIMVAFFWGVFTSPLFKKEFL